MSAVCVIALLAANMPSGTIAFVSHGQVMVVDIGAAAPAPVGPGNHDGAPQWSPDGAWLAFESDAPDGRGIRVARPDGTESRMLELGAPWNFTPRWSPDGARLAYSAADSEDGILEQHVRVYDLASDTESTWGGGQAGLLRPVWLPNLKFLPALGALPSEAGDFDIEQIRTESADGALWCIGLTAGSAGIQSEAMLVTRSQRLPLLRLVARGAYPYAAWAAEPSPNGERLAFESNDGGDREIFVLTQKGTADVSNHHAADWNPVWSPDSRQIAFESFRDGRRGVYRLFAGTGRIAPVAAAPDYACWAPAWSPDGQWLAYVTDESGGPYIRVRRAEDGLGATPIGILANNAGGGCPGLAPAWRPVQEEGD